MDEEKVCEFCGGTGEVSTDEMDSDGNIEHGVGTRKCICQEEDCDEDDDSDLETN